MSSVHAAERGNFVRIDLLEDSTTTDETLRLYRELRAAGYDNVGIVLQARLKRTLDDVRALAELRPNVRIFAKGTCCRAPGVAFRDLDAVAGELRPGPRGTPRRRQLHVGIATHDEWLARAGEAADRGARGRSATRLRVPDADRVSAAPRRPARARGPPATHLHAFGRQWYSSPLRRLQENPKIAGSASRADTVNRLLPAATALVIWARAEGCRVWDERWPRVPRPSRAASASAALGHRESAHLGGPGGAAARRTRSRDLADAAVTARRCASASARRSFGVTGEDAARDRICGRRCSRPASRGSSPPSTALITARGCWRSQATSLEAFRQPFAVRLPAGAPFRLRRDPGPLPGDAGVIAEPVQGARGAWVPPDGFLETLRQRCDEAARCSSATRSTAASAGRA